MKEYKEGIVEALKNGATIKMDHPEMPILAKLGSEAFKELQAFNNEYDLEKARLILTRLLGKPVDSSTTIYPPFFTNYGKNISLGKNVFINHACSFLDLGSIIIEDDVLIGPRVSISSEGHPVKATERKALATAKVHVKKNAWIGAGACILPGVTIGENAIVAAGAVVTKDVAPNTVVGGVPAKVIKEHI